MIKIITIIGIIEIMKIIKIIGIIKIIKIIEINISFQDIAHVFLRLIGSNSSFFIPVSLEMPLMKKRSVKVRVSGKLRFLMS